MMSVRVTYCASARRRTGSATGPGLILVWRKTEMPSIACVIVHPSRVSREGLNTILSKSPFTPVCSVACIDDVPPTIAGLGEQVLVVMGVRDGDNLGEALSTAKARFPDGNFVVVGDSRRRDLVMTAIASGSTSFVDENVATSTLVKELELIAEGEAVISVWILKRLLGPGFTPAMDEAAAPIMLDQPKPPDPDDEPESSRQLSDREAAILNALIQGAPNKVIAYRLKITEATVKVHIKAILRKIQVSNRTQAAIWALHHQALCKPKPEHGAVTLISRPRVTRVARITGQKP
jgi:two-component system nitrate/nitrite response regulator NarL